MKNGYKGLDSMAAKYIKKGIESLTVDNYLVKSNNQY